MSAIYDQEGNHLGDTAAQGGTPPGATPAYVPSGTIGGDLFEFLHPGTVQAEDAAIGQTTIPTTEEIMSGAAGDAETQGVAALTSASTDLVKWIFLGAVAWLIIEASAARRLT